VVCLFVDQPNPVNSYGDSAPISQQFSYSVSGLVVKSIVAIDGPRVRFAADASQLSFVFLPRFHCGHQLQIPEVSGAELLCWMLCWSGRDTQRYWTSQ